MEKKKWWEEENYNHLNATTARFMRLLYFHAYVLQARTYFLLQLNFAAFFPLHLFFFLHPRKSQQ